MLFDQPPVELPTATLRSGSWSVTQLSRMRGVVDARWRWLRPRMVPAIVAIIGMMALLGSANYLTSLARQPPQDQATRATTPPTGILEIVTSGTRIMIDGDSGLLEANFEVAPSRCGFHIDHGNN